MKLVFNNVSSITPPPSELFLKLPSKPQNINLLEPFIKRVCDQFRVNTDQYNDIMLVLTEAVNNSIHHGNACCPDKMVLISTRQSEDLLTFVIQDEGQGFDPSKLPDPTAPENVAEPNGRGVYLMRQFSHDVIVRQRTKDLGCQVVVHFQI